MPAYAFATLSTPPGEIALAVDADGALAALIFTDRPSFACLGPLLLPGAAATLAPALACPALEQLRAYFAGHLSTFSLPLAPAIGTPGQRRTWSALTKIPFGQTWSYARLAREAGGSPRSVGAANAANPLCLVYPCHRVIGSSGSLTGYAGGLERKRWLLKHEGALLA